jgi:hypothetical protein
MRHAPVHRGPSIPQIGEMEEQVPGTEEGADGKYVPVVQLLPGVQLPVTECR